MENSNKKIVAIIQARMGSTRLEKKALKEIMGRTLIEWINYRLGFCKEIDQIVLSTAETPENDPLAEAAEKLGIPVFRGSEKDLISRLLGTAKEFSAQAIVRITGDCPLVDPALVDKLVREYQNNPELDYVCNIFPPTFPDGLDIEVISLPALEKLDKEVKDELRREWLTTTILENPDKFKILNIPCEKGNLSALRLTVDYSEDFELARIIFEELHQDERIFGFDEILELFGKKPELISINEKWVDKTIVDNFRSNEFYKFKKQQIN